MAAVEETLLENSDAEEEKEEEEGDRDESQRRDAEDTGEEFTLNLVRQLGGTKADYIMLYSLNDNEELIDGGKKNAIDDLKEGELESFINKIGIRKYSKFLLEENEECTENEIKKKDKNKNHEKVKEKLQDRRDKQKEFPGKKEKKKLIQDHEASNPSEILSRKIKKQVTLEFEPRSYLLIKPGGKWYNMEYTNEHSSQPQHETLISQYRNLAKQLYEHETNLYRSKQNIQKGANSAWIKTVVKTGTLADRMAAMTLMMQDAPVHTLYFVEELINQIKKKGSRRQYLIALTTLTELLISELLPDNRKLQTFSQHPFNNLEELASGNKDARDKRLILWYFEHLLKHQFAEFVQALETLAHDAVQATKARVLATVHEILCNKPEQEKALLMQLVNKLGDPQYKLAAKASYLLETLLHKHPNMKTVVCCEVERLLFRPNISLKAQYYAICFLNQMVLSHEESDLAGKLISIYFSFFHGYIKKAELDSKMLSALLSGVNRAYPYSKMDDEKVIEQMDTLFRIVHTVNFTTSVQALMLLFQVMDSRQTVSNRYYVALYRRLLDPGLARCSKQAMFLNLLYKSLKSDIVLRRVKAFIKRILQAAYGQTPAFICGALYLISEILKLRPGIRVMLQEHGESDEEEHFKDIDESDEEEIFEDLDEKMKKSEGENYIVHKTDAAKEQKDLQNNNLDGKTESATSASWLHHKNQDKCLGNYDPFHRNPLSCGADRTGLWELKKLSEHFHPSVTHFATTILQGDHIQYPGDPLQDFTLMRFLDRFVYRNPKQHKGKENTDSVVMQPKRKLLLNDVRNLPVNSQKFIEREESQIPVDEIFFHRYYKRLNALKKQQRFRGSDEAVEDVDDDEFEQLLDFYEGEKSYDRLIANSLDFASNMKQQSKNAKQVEADSDLEDDDMGDLDDDEVSLGSLDEEDFEEGVGEDGGMFMDELDDSEEVNSVSAIKKCKTSGKRKKDIDFAKFISGKKPKKGIKDDINMAAAAEEFGYLLDENAGSKFDNIGINAMANKDKASIKQLQWEAERDAWIRGKDARTLRKQKNKFKARKLQNKRKRFLKEKR